MKYWCEHCKNILDEDEVAEVHELGDIRLVCKVCGSDDVYEAAACYLCGEPLPPETAYCEDCEKTMHEAWETAVSYVKENCAPQMPSEEVASILWEFL